VFRSSTRKPLPPPPFLAWLPQGKRVGDVVNRIHVAVPKARDGVSRPPVIPRGVAAARARRDAGEKRRTEKDLQVCRSVGSVCMCACTRLCTSAAGVSAGQWEPCPPPPGPNTRPRILVVCAGGAGRRGRVQLRRQEAVRPEGPGLAVRHHARDHERQEREHEGREGGICVCMGGQTFVGCVCFCVQV
jgi:hypothetical protein